MIRLRDVSVSFDGVPALRSVSLSIGAGESVACIGPNGSGKSTLLKIVCGVLTADAGSFSLDDQAVDRVSLKSQAFAKRFHQRVGLLFQNSDHQLFCPVVRDEIAFGPRQMGLPESEVQDRVDDCLRLLEIPHLDGRTPVALSEGEKRKVALASVLALNPEVLVLDEPMSGLDPRSKRSIADVVRALHAGGKTILCATHDFRYVEGLFQRAVVLSQEHGIVRDDRYETVLADEAFLREQNIL